MTNETTYSFHRAYDHQIIATASPKNLEARANEIGERIHRGLPDGKLKTTRLYVHNGKGVIAAGLCRNDRWNPANVENYRQFNEQARAERKTAGLENDQ